MIVDVCDDLRGAIREGIKIIAREDYHCCAGQDGENA